MGSGQNFYSEEDAEEILRLASREMPGGAMNRERLLATAAELGISPEAVERAEAQLAEKRHADETLRAEQSERAAFRKHLRTDFLGHLGGYVAVNAFLIGIWYVTGAHYFWPMWVIMGWGVGVGADFVDTFLGNNDRAFRRWQRRRARRERRTITPADPDIEACLDRLALEMPGVKLNAIKEIRDQFGLDLRDAKDVVDEYDERHNGIFDRRP